MKSLRPKQPLWTIWHILIDCSKRGKLLFNKINIFRSTYLDEVLERLHFIKFSQCSFQEFWRLNSKNRWRGKVHKTLSMCGPVTRNTKKRWCQKEERDWWENCWESDGPYTVDFFFSIFFTYSQAGTLILFHMGL